MARVAGISLVGNGFFIPLPECRNRMYRPMLLRRARIEGIWLRSSGLLPGAKNLSTFLTVCTNMGIMIPRMEEIGAGEIRQHEQTTPSTTLDMLKFSSCSAHTCRTSVCVSNLRYH
ncbi:hypothetical protein AX15_000764 [Amanita polypyramis BW_CC]|nr:hypothetical protein AX15_000764 [Amanita polypyramis BW_CC]